MNNSELAGFDREEYKILCAEMRQILEDEKRLLAKKATLRVNLISMAGGDRMEYNIKITTRRSTGSIDYKRYCEVNFISEDDLAFFRRPDRVYSEVKVY